MNERSEADNPISIMENLFNKAESYYHLSIEVSKLKALEKSTLMVTKIISKLILMLVILLILLFLSMGLAFYLGELFGKTYYGFLIVSGIYVLIFVFFYYSLYELLLQPVSKLFSEYFNK
ncbi:MAG: hypothetical protein IPM92_12320 [Saprospiraceae bacterium]|nr:hypothetical protein [Saprospiraceae bacterium]